MKKIEAVIRLSQFDDVKDALSEIGVNFFTLQDVKGIGLQKGAKMVYRGSSYDPSYISRIQIDIVVQDGDVEKVVDAILQSGRTGEVGDGKIFVLPMDSITRIRTGETDEEAL